MAESFLDNTSCGLTNNQKELFIANFIGWTGMKYDDYNGEVPEYDDSPPTDSQVDNDGEARNEDLEYPKELVDQALDPSLPYRASLSFKIRNSLLVPGYVSRPNRGYTEQEMLDALQGVKQFSINDLNDTLGLSGRMAELNAVMSMRDLTGYTDQEISQLRANGSLSEQKLEEMATMGRFSETELLAYLAMFHVDMTSIPDMIDAMEEQYGKEYITEGSTDETMASIQDSNTEHYLNALRGLVLEFRVSSLDRLRLWRWREEVLLGRVGNTLPNYPGVPVSYYFETTEELLANGISSYYLRVGEAKRETLMDYYEFFDLYHMAGMLAHAHPDDIKFDSGMIFEDLADLVLLMLNDLALDPRHLLSPLGVQSIFNSEPTEFIFNLSQYKGNIRAANRDPDLENPIGVGTDHDEEKLKLACTHAGIKVSVATEVEVPLDPNLQDPSDLSELVTVNGIDPTINGLPIETTFVTITEPKPVRVLLEELTSQYLSPQFYSAIEHHRNFEGALSSFITLSGDRITNANQSELIFYGVGDGLSTYNVYTPRELVNVFRSTKQFFDPTSIKRNPELPYLWSTFSAQSIQRLLLIVIPRLRVIYHGFSSTGQIQSVTRDPSQTLEDLDRRLYQLETTGEVYREDLNQLEQVIATNFEVLNVVDPDTIDEIIKPMGRQANIIEHLKAHMDNYLNATKENQTLLQSNLPGEDLSLVNYGIRGDLTLFFAHLFNLGQQFSNWTQFTDVNPEAVRQGLLANNNYKYVNPEWTVNLTEKIFNMVTLEFEKYFDVRDVVLDHVDHVPDLSSADVFGSVLDEPANLELRDPVNVEFVNQERKRVQMKRGKQYGQYLRELRLVKHYNDAYRIDWNDELATINGQLLRVVQANKLSLYEYIQTTGNWFMSTAYFYSIVFTGVPPVELSLY